MNSFKKFKNLVAFHIHIKDFSSIFGPHQRVMVDIEIKTLGNFIAILFKNVFEIIELNSFSNSHHKLYVRINMKELKVLTSNYATYHCEIK